MAPSAAAAMQPSALEPEPEPEPRAAAATAQPTAAEVCARDGLMALFDLGRPVTVCAPMVRYSKLPFRLLVRDWGCDVAYTPMIVADSFVNAPQARANEFSTCAADRPLVAQFGSNNAHQLATAAAMIQEHVDGIDINMGCPQRWAMRDGMGAALLREVETVREMVRLVTSATALPFSAKIRIDPELPRTVDLVRQLEATGVSFITVHGRTCHMRSSDPVDLEAVKLVKETVSIPVLANGDVNSLDDMDLVVAKTGVDGVMSARGILANPAMFHPNRYATPPIAAVEEYVQHAMRYGPPTSFAIMHHHLQYMLEKHLSALDRKEFNELMSAPGVFDFLRSKGMRLRPRAAAAGIVA
jgi:tRNA-dihydrouridine synthase 4